MWIISPGCPPFFNPFSMARKKLKHLVERNKKPQRECYVITISKYSEGETCLPWAVGLDRPMLSPSA